MLWVDGHQEYFNSLSAGIDIRRQNLKSKVLVPALKGLTCIFFSHELFNSSFDDYFITRAHSIIARRRIMIKKVKSNVIT